jgi:hypothetical protein
MVRERKDMAPTPIRFRRERERIAGDLVARRLSATEADAQLEQVDDDERPHAEAAARARGSEGISDEALRRRCTTSPAWWRRPAASRGRTRMGGDQRALLRALRAPWPERPALPANRRGAAGFGDDHPAPVR